MTESPNQQFFLEQFQGVLHQLAEGESAGALGVLVDVREAGFVNKELDGHINRLREQPGESVPELVAWLELIVDRLMAFQGDLLQLVGEFSEAEVGLSEAEWSTAESSESSDDPEGFGDFGDFEGFESLADIESFGDFDESDFDFDLGQPIADDLIEVENVDVDVDVDGDGDDMAALFDDLESLDVMDGAPDDAENREPESIDFALIESSVAIEVPPDSEDAKPDVEESELQEDEDEDDFDFDFGFESPEGRNQELNRGFDAENMGLFETSGASEVGADDDILSADPQAQTPGAQDDDDGWGQGFDFGFEEDSVDEEAGDDFAATPAQAPTPGAQNSTAVTRSGDAVSSPLRELEITPPSMPAIPRFGDSSEETAPRLNIEEPTSPGNNEAEVQELRTRASLDDDEFFELAESLAGESSASEKPSWEAPKKSRYRGEPMMTDPRERTPTPRERTPTPRATQATYKLAEESKTRERQDTPNPFAYQAPTGVREALLGSNSSFVLEEISSNEAREDESAVGALMDEAARLFEDGEFESARDLLSALMARDDVSDAAHELAAAVDAELERALQAQLGPLSRTPELNIDMSEIASMTLDHRFGFLLSQIDGMSSFEDILELSSMSRLETLDVLAQMLKREIISVD